MSSSKEGTFSKESKEESSNAGEFTETGSEEKLNEGNDQSVDNGGGKQVLTNGGGEEKPYNGGSHDDAQRKEAKDDAAVTVANSIMEDTAVTNCKKEITAPENGKTMLSMDNQTEPSDVKKQNQNGSKTTEKQSEDKCNSAKETNDLGNCTVASVEKKQDVSTNAAAMKKQSGSGDLNPAKNIEIFPCRICKTGFLKAEQLTKHMQDVHPGSSTFQCTLCSKMFSTEKELEQHNTNAHHLPPPPTPFICKLCGKKFLIKANYEDHQKVHHHGYKPMAAILAQTMSSSEKNSKAPPPIKSASKPSLKPTTPPKTPISTPGTAKPPKKTGPPYECPHCNLKYPLPFLLNKHMIVHNKPFQCPHCKERFIKVEGLNLHKRLIHDVNGMSTFKCIVCGKNDFLLLSDMYTHRMEVHTQISFKGEREKPYGCGVCEKPYQRKGDAFVCAVLGHDPTTLYKDMFYHKCTECDPSLAELGYHSIRALKQHWMKEHADKHFPEETLLEENGYSFDCPLPKVTIDKREAYDLKEKGTAPQTGKEKGTSLILEFDQLPGKSEESSEGEKITCVIPVFACPDCPLTFIDVESLRIHEQVHLQDEGPPSSKSTAVKRGRPSTSTKVKMGSMKNEETGNDAVSPSPISLVPPTAAGNPLGQHLVAKFGCVVCGKKFRKLKRLRDHEQIHLMMDPNCPIFPKTSAGGRKPKVLGAVKKNIAASASGTGGMIKKNIRSKKVPFWVPTSAKAAILSGGAGSGGDANIKNQKIMMRSYRCQLCPASFTYSKGLRVHELNIHKAPHKKPGRKKKTDDSRNSKTDLSSTAAAEEKGEEVKDSKSKVELQPGRIRVGRLEISSKFNKMIKTNSPIKICVTDENGQSVSHFQCPACPKVFKDRRGIHLHMLGHSLKSHSFEGQNKNKESTDVEKEKSIDRVEKERRAMPQAAILSQRRRTSDRERRAPRKLSEYEVDEEMTPSGTQSPTAESGNDDKDYKPTISVAAPEGSVAVKKDGRGRPRKYPLPPQYFGKTENNEQVMGEIIGSKLPPTVDYYGSGKEEVTTKVQGKASAESGESSSEDEQDMLEDDDDTEDSMDSRSRSSSPPRPMPKPTCGKCGESFDSVTELWYHGNEKHNNSKVKYVPKKVEETKTVTTAKPPAAPAVTPAHKVVPHTLTQKQPALLSLLHKKRAEQQQNAAAAAAAAAAAGKSIPTPPAPVIPPKPMALPVANQKIILPVPPTVVPAVEQDTVKRKGRPRKIRNMEEEKPKAEKSLLEDGVRRIGQLKIPHKFRNKDVLRRERPLIITETLEDGKTVTVYKCPHCPRVFRDKRGFPFHSLCHLIMTEKKSSPTSGKKAKPSQEGTADDGPAAASTKKLVKKMPSLIPLSDVKTLGQSEQDAQAEQDAQSVLPSGSKTGQEGTTGKVSATAADVSASDKASSSMRTSASIPEKLLKGKGHSSENSTSGPTQNQQQGEVPLIKPVLSPTSNEFRFKIIKQSVILPFKKKRGRPSTKYLMYMKGAQQKLQSVTSAVPTSSSENTGANEGNQATQQSNVALGVGTEHNKRKGSLANKKRLNSLKATTVTKVDIGAGGGDINKSSSETVIKEADAMLSTIKVENEPAVQDKGKQGAQPVKEIGNAGPSKTLKNGGTKRPVGRNASEGKVPRKIAKEEVDVSDILAEDSSTGKLSNSPDTSGALPRKRGRPRKAVSLGVTHVNTPTLSTTDATTKKEDEDKTVKMEESVEELSPSGLSFAQWPQQAEIDVSPEEMAALKRAMEKNGKEVQDRVTVSTASSITSITASVAKPSTAVDNARESVLSAVDSHIQSVVKRKGRPPKTTKNAAVKNPVITPKSQKLTPAAADVIISPAAPKGTLLSLAPPLKTYGRQSKRSLPPRQTPEEVTTTPGQSTDLPKDPEPVNTPTATTPMTPAEEGSSPPSKKARGRPRKYPVSAPTTPLSTVSSYAPLAEPEALKSAKIPSTKMKAAEARPVSPAEVPVPIPIKISKALLSPDIVQLVTTNTNTGDPSPEAKRRRGRPRKSMPALTAASAE